MIGARNVGVWRGDRGGRSLGQERGSASLELVIVAPALLLLLAVIIYGGRLAVAQQSVQAAANQAARDASIARTAGAAQSAAGQTAAVALASAGLTCQSSTVSVNTAGFDAPLGARSAVSTTVTCVVSVGDLFIPGVPGTQTVTATAESPLDSYRERG